MSKSLKFLLTLPLDLHQQVPTHSSFVKTLKTIKKVGSLLLMIACATLGISAQEIALKTNVVDDALLSPSLGIEFTTAPKWSFDISGSYNNWTVNEHNWKHWAVKPEMRYWFCESMSGHFLGLHLLGGQYNVGNLDMDLMFLGTDLSKLKDRRYEGWFVGAGIGYGYTWILNKHWSISAELGFGWTYTRYDSYPCAKCGRKLDNNKVHNYVGPTKVALNLIYVLP